MSSLYAYLHIILLIFNNMIQNIGPDGDSAYFSARDHMCYMLKTTQNTTKYIKFT